MGLGIRRRNNKRLPEGLFYRDLGRGMGSATSQVRARRD